MLCYRHALVSGPGTRSAARLAVICIAFVAAGVSVATAAKPVTSSVDVLHARTHRALLDLYALDTRLHAAQARLSALETQTARLQHEQVLLAQQLAATRHTLSVSRRALEMSLRSLYKRGDVN